MSSITQNNDNSSESLLKEDSIENIFKYDYTEKKTYTTDITLQIIHMKKNETGNIDNPNEIYTASLCDKKFSYNRFVICRNPSLPLIEEGDLIKITKIHPMKLESQPERIILIKEYTPLGIKEEIKGTTLMKEALAYAVKEEDSNVGNMEEEEVKVGEISKYIPLNQLTTFSKEFIVYVRVVSKSEIKRFNGKRSGSLFDFVVIDEEGTKMQIVCFDKTVDKFYGMIHENNCYEISGGYIKINDRKYNALNSEYKIILGEHSSVIQKEDNHKIKLESMALTSIQEIMSMKINSVINVLCLVIDEGKKIVKTTRNGDQEMRRTIVIDKTGTKIELTLWRQFANMNIQRENVLLLKKVRVGDFNGRNLSSLNETNITISPTEPSLKNEIDELIKYFIAHKNEMYTPHQYEDNKISNQSTNVNSSIINSIIKEEKNTNINPIGKIDFLQSIIDSMSEEEGIRYPFYKIKATVTHLSHNDKNFYPGCPDKECARKLVYDINKWVCQRCKRTYDSPRYYYSLNIRVKDCSCEYWIDIFGKTAESFLNMTAGNYRALLINRDEDKLRAISCRIENNDFYFLVKPKVQKFNNIPKKKFSVNKIENVDMRKEAYRLLEQLKEKLFNK